MITELQFDKKVALHITQEDIDNGAQGHSLLCPISIAMGRHINITEGDSIATTMREVIFFQESDHTKPEGDYTVLAVYKLPEEGKAFIKLYDGFGSKHVEPCTFDLTLKT